MGLPILCVDFDGVIHSYTSGWQGANVISDPPVPGALRWLWQCMEQFEVNIYSSRSSDYYGVRAMQEWLERYANEEFDTTTASRFMRLLHFPLAKPPAFLTIDDRAIQFNGDFTALVMHPSNLRKFKPWNKRS